MTDNEIRPYDGMTTLEQLNLYRNLHYCEGLANERGIIANAINDIIVQFNRQKAEIEALIAGQETLQKYIAEQKAEIERLKTTIDGFTEIGKLYSEIKAEAIKEFAERLKKYEGRRGAPIATIDNLVKEMVGDGECEK